MFSLIFVNQSKNGEQMRVIFKPSPDIVTQTADFVNMIFSEESANELSAKKSFPTVLLMGADVCRNCRRLPGNSRCPQFRRPKQTLWVLERCSIKYYPDKANLVEVTHTLETVSLLRKHLKIMYSNQTLLVRKTEDPPTWIQPTNQ